MNELVAWSYSRLESSETCARKFWHLSIKKDVIDPPNDKTQYGTDMHQAFASYLKKGQALPLAMRHHTPMLAKFRAAPGEHVIEQQIAINANYQQVGWFDKDVYCRVISDLTIMQAPAAIMVDWKSGKLKDDFTQLRVAAAVMFLIAPELERISMSYVWTQSKQVTTDRMTRDETTDVWAALHPRLVRYQNMFNLQEFPATPGIHCKWCPVKSCPYNEKKK